MRYTGPNHVEERDHLVIYVKIWKTHTLSKVKT